MSFQAITWAFNQPVTSCTAKFLLVCLANYANEGFKAYPSIKALSDLTGMNRKTVILGLDKLQNAKFISDTGQRVGETRQIKVYQLNSPKLGTVPKTEQSLNIRERVPIFPERVPKTGHGSYQEPVMEPKGEKKALGKYIREIRIQIEEAEQERQRLKDAHANVSATGTDWNDQEARLEFVELGKKIKQWRKEILSR